MRKISDHLAEGSHGFDYLRLALALGVIVHHAFSLTIDGGGAQLQAMGWFRVTSHLPVPMFFAVSGFLVAASADRHSLAVYAAYRALRVLPALLVVTLIGMFVVGPFATTLPLGEYFRNIQLWTEPLILIGVQQTYLPGFKGHNIVDFNGALWTIPWEMACYYGLAILAAIGAFRRPWILLVVLAAAMIYAPPPMPKPMPTILMVCFAAGACLYAFRGWVRTSLVSGLLALGLTCALYYFDVGGLLAALPLTYAAVALGLQRARPLPADWSYGVYISAFPVQQMLSLTGWGRHWWVNLSVTTVVACAFAALSWRFVEAPALALKPRVRRWLEARGAGRRVAAGQLSAAE